jgi:hypothetical protein
VNRASERQGHSEIKQQGERETKGANKEQKGKKRKKQGLQHSQKQYHPPFLSLLLNTSLSITAEDEDKAGSTEDLTAPVTWTPSLQEPG